MNLVLVGYRGTGKSSVARLLADRLGLALVDADAELEAQAGCTIRELFATRGEPYFRELEAEILAQLEGRDLLVLATGGGVVLRAENRDRLRRLGLVIWLKADAATLAARIAADGNTADHRPSLLPGQADEVAVLLAQREPLYQEVATLEVDAARHSPEAIAEEILRRIDLPPRGGRA
jgi:shikimate kinase